MPRHVRAAVLTVGLLGPPTLAHAQLNESPITPGFWSFPAKRLKLQKMPLLPVATTSKFGLPVATLLVFSCKELSGVVSSDMSAKVGRCAFSGETQIETCSVRMTNYDGSVLTGTLKKQVLARRKHFDDKGHPRDDH